MKLSRYAEDPAKYINPYITTTPAKEFPTVSHTSPLDDFHLEWNEPLQLTSDFFTYDYCDSDNLLRPMTAMKQEPKPKQEVYLTKTITTSPKLSKKIEKKKKKSPLQSQMHTCTGDVCMECNRGSSGFQGSHKLAPNSTNSGHLVSKKKKKKSHLIQSKAFD